MLLLRSFDYQIHLYGLYCSGVYKTFRTLLVEIVYIEKSLHRSQITCEWRTTYDCT